MTNDATEAKRDATSQLIDAAYMSDVNGARTAIANGAKVNAKRPPTQETPLHLAALDGPIELVRLLIDNDANVNARDKDRLTPLHTAILQDRNAIPELLIENGADINAKDAYRRTPLFLAAFKGNTELAKLLIEKGSDINARSGDDNTTPLTLAQALGRDDIVALLREAAEKQSSHTARISNQRGSKAEPQVG